MIRWASTGPIPGRASRSDAVAELRFTGPPGGAPDADPDAPDAAPGPPTAICWPSPTTAARFTDAGSASGSSPPAASTASATRDPDGRLTSPGRATRPTTETTTVLAVSATSATEGVAGAAVPVPVPVAVPVPVSVLVPVPGSVTVDVPVPASSTRST